MNHNENNNQNSLMNPQVDYVFKSIFGNEKHPNVLISLLNAIFGYVDDSPKRITAVHIENPQITKEMLDAKSSVLDIRATINNNDIVNIEMQIKNEYNIKERSMFYLSKIFGGQLKAKKNYRSLKKCVVICILNFNLFIEDNNRVHRNFLFKDTKTNDALSDLMELHYIELPKLQQQIDKLNLNDLLTDWLLFLTSPESEVVTMLKKKVPEIKEAVSILDILSKDKEARQIYEMRERAMLNESTNIEAAKEEGKIEGEQIGEHKAQVAMIKEMLHAGFELSIIEKISHMSKTEIEKIKNTMH